MRLSPHLPASPALGACRQYRLSNPLEGLIGSKINLSVPVTGRKFDAVIYGPSHDGSIQGVLMDIGIIAAIALLVIWAVGALLMEGPGWIHLFLTLGVSL